MSTESAVDEDERAVATWQSYGNVEEEGTGPAGGAKGAAKVVNWLKITLNTAGRKAAANKATHRAVGPPNGTRIDPFALDITMPSETVDPTKSAHGQGDDQQEPMRYPEAPVASASSLNSRPGPPIDLVDDDTTEDGLYTDQMPSSPSFFKFEFETDAPQSDAFDARKSTHSEARKSAHGSIKASKRASGHAGDDSDTVYPGGVMSPLRKSGSIQASPRVS